MLSRARTLWRAAVSPDVSAAWMGATKINHRTKKSRSGSRTSKAAVAFEEESSHPNLSKYEDGMKKALDVLSESFSRLRTGGASPAVLDDVSVDAYGAQTSLRNVAQVAVRDARNLMVSVFDEATSKAVEKAIRGSGLNLNPIAEGNGKLRVPIPKASNQTRLALKETAAKAAEAAKIATRMIRRKAMDDVKRLKETLSNDEIKRMEKNIQTLTDRYIQNISESQKSKNTAIETGEHT